MQYEQLEAKVEELARPGELPLGDYCLSRQQFFALVAVAYEAGRNFGFQEGGRHVIETYDAALIKVRIAE